MLTNLFNKRLAVIAVCISFSLALPANAHAWGMEGHRITARIAAKYLNSRARAEVVILLRTAIRNGPVYYQENCPNVLRLSKKRTLSKAVEEKFLIEGLACIAPWPDPPVKAQRRYTSNWHFVDIPVVMSNGGGSAPLRFTYDPARDCVMSEKDGDCAAQALMRLQEVLGNKKISANKDDMYREELTSRAEALIFFVHIVGDIHQPLHCVTDKKDKKAVSDPRDIGDMGGNLKIATWFGVDQTPYGPMNLHSIWDTGIITETLKDQKITEAQYNQNLLNAIPARGSTELSEMQKGNFFEWFDESYDLAVRKAYGELPKLDAKCVVEGKNGKLTGCYRLADDYYNTNKGVVDHQLILGGIRLARLLNELLGK